MKSISLYYENYNGLQNFVNENYDYLYDKNQSALLIQVFSGCCEQEYLNKTVSEIIELLPHACVVGMTTSGEIMNGGVSELKTVVSFSVFYHSNVRGKLFTAHGQDDFKVGVSIVGELDSKHAKILLLFAAGTSINTVELLKGIKKANPALPIAGGIAGDAYYNKPAIVAYNGQITDDGAVGVVLEGDLLTVNCFQHLGWQPIGKFMTVTKVIGTRVFTIDNLPAYKVYQKYLGIAKTQDFMSAWEYPLMLERDGVQLARVPVKLYDDDSIGFIADVVEGDRVRLGFGNIGVILDNIDGLCASIRQHPVETIFVYSCSCRKLFLQNFSKYEILPLYKIAPIAGFFTSGEFLHVESSNYLLNATMTVLAISECSEATLEPGLCDPISFAISEDNHDRMMQSDIGVLKALAHLTDAVTSELEQAQEQLKYNVIGEMAAALGHEVRNPLTTVRGYLQMFQHKECFENYHSQIATMIEELDQANAIITEFLSLSKNKMVELKLGSINNVLETLYPLLQANAFQRGHHIHMELGEIPDIRFDARELRQIIINLVHNGLDAMEEAGLLSIRTYASEQEVALSVQDSGTGIPPELLDKLGTPFITTKDKGTGLGLSICYRIAHRHGAKIKIRTGSKGTTIAVIFKIAE